MLYIREEGWKELKVGCFFEVEWAWQKDPASQDWIESGRACHNSAGYFAHNQHRMDYLELRKEGWLIGSGMAESGGKRFRIDLRGQECAGAGQGPNAGCRSEQRS